MTNQERGEAEAMFSKVENLEQVKKTDLMIGTTISHVAPTEGVVEQEKNMEAELEIEDK